MSVDDLAMNAKRIGLQSVELLDPEEFDVVVKHGLIMEGDVIRTIHDNHRHIAHYHTGGVPGHHEIDEDQELFYPAIMRAIRDTGFTGYVAQEFIPARVPMESLADAVRRCVV